MKLIATAGRLTAALLGLTLGVASSGSAVAQDVVPPKAYTTTPGGINASDGNFVYSQTDLSMGPLTLERYHRGGSRQPNYGMFGHNFSSNFDIYIANSEVFNSEKILTIHIGNTATGQYYQSNDSPTSTGPRNYDADKGRLTWTGSQFVYMDSAGTIYTFSATIPAPGVIFGATQSRRVERIDFPDGRRQTFSYTAGGKPKLVEDSSGYAAVFDYNANGNVSVACIFKRSETFVDASSMCANAALKTTYEYTTLSGPKYVLTSVVDANGKNTTYTNTVGGVTCVTPPGQSGCQMTQGGGPSHSAPNFSNTQTLADGGTWQISGQDWEVVVRGDDSSPASQNGHVEVYVTDPSNQVTELTFTKSSPYTIVDPLGRITRFRFEGGPPEYSAYAMYFWGGQLSFGTMLREAIYPEGDRYQADYGGPFRAVTAERHVPKGGGTALERLYQYGSCTVSPGTYQNCAKPIAVRDPAGNWTQYAYWPHGGIWTEMAPAPLANAARPLKVTTWVQRYAWIRDSNNALAQNVSLPVWVKSTETVCQTAAGPGPAAVCDGTQPQTMTTYEYGANGTGQSLLVKGVVLTANGTSLRTCYGYDAFDRKIFETQPNAGLSSCS